MPTVLVTNGWGSLGQGILRVLRDLHLGLRLVAVSRIAPCGASLYVDALHQVPPYRLSGELADVRPLVDICEKEAIDLIIPSTDYETFLFKSYEALLPPVACSDARTSFILYDKYETVQAFRAKGLPFVETWLPSDYVKSPASGTEVVAKPRRGSLSRGLRFRPSVNEVTGMDDSEFLVQRLASGTEITVPFYVTQSGRLHGLIVLERQLWNGITALCTVNHAFDAEVAVVINRIVASFPIRGSCNLQAKIENDTIVPFELNGRVSGTASIRHVLGFRDIEYLIDEYIFHRDPQLPKVVDGSAIRVVHDYIFPGYGLSEMVAVDRRNPGVRFF